VVTVPFGVRVGINAFLAGFIPTENLRFIDDSMTFKISQRAEAGGELGKNDVMRSYNYPSMTKTMTKGMAKFIRYFEGGMFTDSEIIVLLGENGTGKTTFVRMLAGFLKLDEQVKLEDEGMDYEASLAGAPDLNVSYKPQNISPKFPGTIRQLLHKRVRESYIHP
jgi:ATP-binding cassette subfamily E protein 1